MYIIGLWKIQTKGDEEWRPNEGYKKLVESFIKSYPEKEGTGLSWISSEHIN